MADIRRILDNIDREEIETYINEVDQRLISVDEDLQNQINVNKNDIATNKANIESNDADIKANNDLIIANTNNIDNLANTHMEDKRYLDDRITNLDTYVKEEDIRLTNYIDSENIRTKDELYTYLGTIQQNLNNKDDELNTKIDTNTETLQNNIDNVSDRLNTVANSDDETLDQLSEIVAYIKNNKDLIDGITTNKTNVEDFNALAERVATTEGEIDVLQSDVGTAQSDISTLQINVGTAQTDIDTLETKTNDLQVSYNAIPSWSLEDTKPSYTYDEVGADAAGTAVSEVANHNSSETAHSDIRDLVNDLIARVEALENLISTDESGQ